MPCIEHDFPIEGLNKIAQKEGNARNPIHQMHKTSAIRQTLEDGSVPVTESRDTQLRTSISEFLDSLFREAFGEQTEYDPEVVRLIKEHLGQRFLHPRAGLRLAEALVQLAKARAGEGNQ